MKKVVLVFGGTRFSENTFQFARRLNKLQPILLVGVFLPDVVYADIYSFGSGLPASYLSPVMDVNDAKIRRENINRFTQLCVQNSIACRVHEELDGSALPALKRETRFADLLLVSNEKFYDNLLFNNANPSMKEVLHAAECPVVVVPEKGHFPECNILAYDGSEDSVFAIRQFAYLFPELCGNETLLVYVKEEQRPGFPDETNIEELVTQHFKDLNLLKLHLNPHKFFKAWLYERKNAILIGGSYGRSSASELFRKSFMAEVLAEHRMPVFIAHR